jgi:hypothetical protein
MIVICYNPLNLDTFNFFKNNKKVKTLINTEIVVLLDKKLIY